MSYYLRTLAGSRSKTAYETVGEAFASAPLDFTGVLLIVDERGETHGIVYIDPLWEPTSPSFTEGARLIRNERIRQIEVKGRTADSDDEWRLGELANAAAFMASPPGPDLHMGLGGAFMEWVEKKRTMDRIRQLVVAGALVAAEIDRLLRLEAKNG